MKEAAAGAGKAKARVAVDDDEVGEGGAEGR